MMKKNDIKEAISYANDVIKGKIVAGKLIQLACQRFIDDISDDSEYYLNTDKVNHCLKFLNLFKHYTGKSSGQQFLLLPFQVFVVANLVGVYHKESGERKYTQAYIQMSRKNGKSFFAGALCLYFLIADNEPSAEVLLLSNSRQQAKDVDFAVISALCKQLDNKQRTIKQFRDYVTIPSTLSKLKVLASESKTGDGYNVSMGLIDEYHEAPDSKMKDLIVSSQGMRKNPLAVIITTAGFDKNKPCYKLRNYGIEVLNKFKDDESFFIAIYELDENDDWLDEKNWIKSNPCYRITVTEKYLKEQINKAKNNPSDEVGIKTKNLNIWCSSAEKWIADNYIIDSTQNINIQDFKGSSCWVGVDLASVSDLTAVSFMIPKEDKYYFLTKYYLPESALIDKQDKEKYKLWRAMGYLTVTAGNVTDYDYITTDIMKMREVLNIQTIFYDSYNSTQWAIDATDKGLNLEPFSQSIGNYNIPTKEFERLILSNCIVLDNNEITRFCLSNVSLKYDYNNNCKPVKTLLNNKIDGVISMLTALGGYLKSTHYNNNIYII